MGTDFISEHKALAFHIAGKFVPVDGDRAAVESDALLGLLTASATYSPTGGRSRSSWASFTIRNAIIDGLRSRVGRSDREVYSREERRIPVPLDEAELIEGPDSYSAVETTVDVERALRRLTPAERELIHERYWLDHTLREIGADRGVTESRACQQLSAARAKLRPLLTV